MAMDVELLVDHARVLTLDDGRPGPLAGASQGWLGLVEDGAVAVDGGRIALVGRRDEIASRSRPRHVYDACGAVVMPGLVDAHAHPIWAGNRAGEFEQRVAGAGYLEIMAAGGGIASTVRETRAATDQELMAGLMLRLDRFLAQGTTTLEAKTGYGLSAYDELRQLRLLRQADDRHAVRLVLTFLGAHALPDEYAGDPDAYVEIVVGEMLPEVAAACPEAFCDVFCDRGAFTLEQSERVLRAALEVGLRIKVHSDEFENLGCTRLAARLGATSADHLAVTSPSEMDAMAESGTVAVLLPGTSFGLGSSHYAEAREFVGRNVPVALGTDYNPGTCPCESLPFMVALATRFMRMSPAQAVVAVTRNGAAAVGLDEEAGRLAPGRRADLLLLDGSDYRDLGYRFGSSLVRGVMVGGEWVIRP